MIEHDPLASLPDLIELGIDVSNVVLAESLLASVSADIREAAGAPISLTTATITTGGTSESYMRIPGGPVRSVATVKLDGKPIDDWRLIDGQLWRCTGWGHPHVPLTITYEHGRDPVPSDIVRLTCMLVSAGIHAAEDGFGANRGKAYESGDDYRIGYLQGGDEIIDPTEIPERTRIRLRERFGASAYVTRGY